jgi:pimeloyl-ACP methyl ester carboxylesterase
MKAAARAYEVQRHAGHMMMLEAPEEFCRIVRAMINGAP